jgi:hypothetical protein
MKRPYCLWHHSERRSPLTGCRPCLHFLFYLRHGRPRDDADLLHVHCDDLSYLHAHPHVHDENALLGNPHPCLRGGALACGTDGVRSSRDVHVREHWHDQRNVRVDLGASAGDHVHLNGGHGAWDEVGEGELEDEPWGGGHGERLATKSVRL